VSVRDKNTLAYYTLALNSEMKSFIVAAPVVLPGGNNLGNWNDSWSAESLPPGGDVIKLFWCVILHFFLVSWSVSFVSVRFLIENNLLILHR
jgi:hypothetical protein